MTHQDTCITQLTCDPASENGFGLVLSSGVFATDFMSGPKLIDIVVEGSPADNSGVIQVRGRKKFFLQLLPDDCPLIIIIMMVCSNNVKCLITRPCPIQKNEP